MASCNAAGAVDGVVSVLVSLLAKHGLGTSSRPATKCVSHLAKTDAFGGGVVQRAHAKGLSLMGESPQLHGGKGVKR